MTDLSFLVLCTVGLFVIVHLILRTEEKHPLFTLLVAMFIITLLGIIARL